MILKANYNGTIREFDIAQITDVPNITATKSGTTTTIYKNGTSIATIEDGDKGDTGNTGPQGQQGDKGDTGDSGVYIGTTAPTNNANVWIDTSGSADNVQTTSNLVTSLSSSSADTQYPSAKCVYDIIGNLETLLASI